MLATLIGALRNPRSNVRAALGLAVAGWALAQLQRAATEMNDAATEAEARLARILLSEEEAHHKLRRDREQLEYVKSERWRLAGGRPAEVDVVAEGVKVDPIRATVDAMTS